MLCVCDWPAYTLEFLKSILFIASNVITCQTFLLKTLQCLPMHFHRILIKDHGCKGHQWSLPTYLSPWDTILYHLQLLSVPLTHHPSRMAFYALAILCLGCFCSRSPHTWFTLCTALISNFNFPWMPFFWLLNKVAFHPLPLPYRLTLFSDTI